MFDAIETAKGKPNSPLRSLYIGTVAPSMGGWWAALATSKSGQGRVVMTLQGDRERWDDWREVARVNPLTKVSADFRRQLRSELKAAIADSRLKARFLSYRLNLPSADEATMLLSVSDFELMAAREVPARAGRPIGGLTLAADGPGARRRRYGKAGALRRLPSRRACRGSTLKRIATK